MSRSMKKTPITGHCVCRSEKRWKTIAHRKDRRVVKLAIALGQEMPHHREISNVLDWGKDGKTWIGNYYCENSWMEDNLRRMMGK